jgi:hypothetical protein
MTWRFPQYTPLPEPASLISRRQEHRPADDDADAPLLREVVAHADVDDVLRRRERSRRARELH